jgi:hypothetical protein
VNSVIYGVLSKKSNDIMCEAGVDEDSFYLIYEAKTENFVLVQTHIVMRGHVLSPLITSLQEDTIRKECLQESKQLYSYKGNAFGRKLLHKKTGNILPLLK